MTEMARRSEDYSASNAVPPTGVSPPRSPLKGQNTTLRSIGVGDDGLEADGSNAFADRAQVQRGGEVAWGEAYGAGLAGLRQPHGLQDMT